jgi:acyl-CoA synthetase (AMP-forming)/AMP-acid ligase II
MNVGCMLMNMTTRYRHSVALTDGDRSLTYDELNRRTNRLATVLRDEYQLHSRDRVATLCHKLVEPTSH